MFFQKLFNLNLKRENNILKRKLEIDSEINKKKDKEILLLKRNAFFRDDLGRFQKKGRVSSFIRKETRRIWGI